MEHVEVHRLRPRRGEQLDGKRDQTKTDVAFPNRSGHDQPPLGNRPRSGRIRIRYASLRKIDILSIELVQNIGLVNGTFRMVNSG